MAFAKPLLKTLLGALTRTPADKAEIRQQAVLGVEPLGQGVRVAGSGGSPVPVPVSGTGKPHVGDTVPVVWEKGRPKLALFHQIRRAKAGWDVPGGPIVEELFIATDPATGRKEVWFRNGTVVDSLKLRDQLGADPKGVKWGVNKTGFYVLTEDDVYVVFELDREPETGLEAAPEATELYRVQPFDSEAVITTFHLDLSIDGTVQKIQPKRDYELEVHYGSVLNFDDIGAHILGSFVDGAPFFANGTTLYMDEFITIDAAGSTGGPHRFWDPTGETSRVYTFTDTENREALSFTGTLQLDFPVKGKDLAVYDVVLEADNRLLACSVLSYSAAIMSALQRHAEGEEGVSEPDPGYEAYVASEHPSFLASPWIAAAMEATYSAGARAFFEGPGFGLVDLDDPVSSMKARLAMLKQAGWSLDPFGFQSPFYRSGEFFQAPISTPVLWDMRSGAVLAAGFTGEPGLTVASVASYEWFSPLQGVGHEHFHEHRASDQPIQWTIEDHVVVVTQTEGGETVEHDSDLEDIPYTFNPGGLYPFTGSTHYTSDNGVRSLDFLPTLAALIGSLGLPDEFFHVCPSKFVTRNDVTVDDQFLFAPDEGGRVGRALTVQSCQTQPWWGLPVDLQPPATPGTPQRVTHLLLPFDLVSYDPDAVGFCDPLVFVSLSHLVQEYTFALVLTDVGLQLAKILLKDTAPPNGFFQRTNDHTPTLLSASETHVFWGDVMFVETDPVKLWIAERLGSGGPELVAAGQGDAIAPETADDALVKFLKRRFMLLAPNALYWPDDGEATKVDPKDEGNKFIEWIGPDGVTLTVDAGEDPPERDEMSAQGVLAELPEEPAVTPRVYGFEDDDAPSGLMLASVKTVRNPTHQLIVDPSSLGGGSIDEP